METNRQKKQMNRWLYVVTGVIVLLLAGLVYAWTVMSKTIGAEQRGGTANCFAGSSMGHDRA